MGLLSFISGIFKPAADLIDNVHTSTEEKMQLRNALAKIEADVAMKSIELESKMLELQGKLAESTAKVAAAEAESESWFVRHYRPMIITSMFLMIVLESAGILKTQLPEMFWQIFAAAFGVMTVGPSIAKSGAGVVKSVVEAFKKK
jgi:hypothetical protein